MRVEILEDRLSDTDADTDRHYLQHKGDVITVPDPLGEKWCKHGWAKDLEGKAETGERVPGASQLDVQNAKAAAKAAVR